MLLLLLVSVYSPLRRWWYTKRLKGFVPASAWLLWTDDRWEGIIDRKCRIILSTGHCATIGFVKSQLLCCAVLDRQFARDLMEWRQQRRLQGKAELFSIGPGRWVFVFSLLLTSLIIAKTFSCGSIVILGSPLQRRSCYVLHGSTGNFGSN